MRLPREARARLARRIAARRALRADSVNDFPADTAIESLTVAAGYTIAGNAIRLSGGTLANVPAGSVATLALPLNGAGGLTKAGGGTLTLGAANTYTGATAVNAGTLLVNNTAGTGSAAVDQRFVYDGWNLIAILDSQSSILQSFCWGRI